ncbi:MAG: hypothetical protein ACREQQ_15590, partial [Candidatus Binatia bacterium]
ASRVANEARRHQILVTAEVRKEAAALPVVEFAPVGKRRLKGLAEEIELYEARADVGAERERAIDPICGMELTPAGVSATLSLAGKTLSFCSEGCLGRFVESRKR